MAKRKILTYENDWGHDHYFIDGIRIEPSKIDEVIIYKKKYKTSVKRYTLEVREHDKNYSVLSDHLVVTEKVFGIPMEFDLNKIATKVKVYVSRLK